MTSLITLRGVRRFSGAAMVAAITAATVQAELTTGDIVANAYCPDCIQFTPSGICIWMTCTPWGCDIDYSLRVTHFIPEAVVTSYTTQAPWPSWAIETSGTLAQGHPPESSNDASHLDYKNVEVHGSPALYTFNALADSYDYFCPSNITAFYPYFISTLDMYGWRSGITELLYPSSWLGMFGTQVGSFYESWGSLYPRIGWLVQMEDPKAAAVMAQRAADFVTRSGQPHVYIQMPEGDENCQDGDKRCWPPGEVEVNDASTHTWQMLYPNMETTCDIFGEDADYADNRYNDLEQYAYHLWRPWSCCPREGAIFVGAVISGGEGGDP